MSDLATYLAGLKAGDVVMLNWYDTPVPKTIERVTPTQIIADGDKFHRTGDRAGQIIRPASRRSRFTRYDEPGLITQAKADALIREQERKQVLHQATKELAQPLTLDTIPAMRAALDRAEAALREGEE